MRFQHILQPRLDRDPDCAINLDLSTREEWDISRKRQTIDLTTQHNVQLNALVNDLYKVFDTSRIYVAKLLNVSDLKHKLYSRVNELTDLAMRVYRSHYVTELRFERKCLPVHIVHTCTHYVTPCTGVRSVRPSVRPPVCDIYRSFGAVFYLFISEWYGMSDILVCESVFDFMDPIVCGSVCGEPRSCLGDRLVENKDHSPCFTV